MGAFERGPTLWVALAILAGMILGTLAPGASGVPAGPDCASGNLVVAVLIWAMVGPMMIATDFGALAGGWAWATALPRRIAVLGPLNGAWNFVELAVAVAIGFLGLNAGAALAAVVGVLVEVPVMLSRVALANRTGNRFPA